MITYAEFHERLCDQIAEYYQTGRVCELRRPANPVDERLMQCVWSEQLLNPGGLKTLSGRSVSVLHPGDWNHGPGPDFLGAEILLDGAPARGDVELHLRSSDFQAHRHDQDFVYNNLILHAFLSRTDERERDLLQNQRFVERLELEPFLFPDLETIRRTVQPEEIRFQEQGAPGKCRPVFLDWDFELLREFLNAAGHERLSRKTERLREQLDGECIEQVFYQALMTIMGVKGGKALYFLLAKRAPFLELEEFTRGCDPLERPVVLESIFYHLAGLLPDAAQYAQLDAVERVYLEGLTAHWRELEPYFSDRLIPPTKRWHRGIRPGNFPQRRLSGVARWLAPRLGDRNLIPALRRQFQHSLPALWNAKNTRKFVNGWLQCFVVNDDSHWCRRYSWGGKIARAQTALIGEDHARAILLNVLLPLLLLIARCERDELLEAQVRKAWANFPPLPPNQIVRRMSGRLFEGNANAQALLNTGQRQQALHQVFDEFCNGDSQSCAQCALFEREFFGKTENQ